jgi:hypothetical protein
MNQSQGQALPFNHNHSGSAMWEMAQNCDACLARNALRLDIAASLAKSINRIYGANKSLSSSQLDVAAKVAVDRIESSLRWNDRMMDENRGDYLNTAHLSRNTLE